MGYLDDAINKARQGKAPGQRPKGNTHAHSSLTPGGSPQEQPSASSPPLPAAEPKATRDAALPSDHPAVSPQWFAPTDELSLAPQSPLAEPEPSTIASLMACQPVSEPANDPPALSPQELAMQLAPAGGSPDPIQAMEDLAQSVQQVLTPEAKPQEPVPSDPVSLVMERQAQAPVEPSSPAVPDIPCIEAAAAKAAVVESPSLTPHEPSAAHVAQSILGQAPGLPTRQAESDAKARDERLVILDDPASIMAEEYRSIRTSLLARWQNKRHLVHTITSATPQEGKTITSLNLGLCLAELRNRRTIVVEVDLRLPQYDRLLALKPGPGLVGYLEGKADLNQVIQQLKESPLHVIAAGGNAGNSAVQLVSSPQMADLIKTLREHYDHVIIDTPPVVELADAGILGAMSDDVLLIVRMQMTPRPLVEQAIRTLASYNAPVGGLIATDQHHHRGGYYYKYGYRYGYGRYYHYHSKKKPHRD